jgi:hypothetical protein
MTMNALVLAALDSAVACASANTGVRIAPRVTQARPMRRKRVCMCFDVIIT